VKPTIDWGALRALPIPSVWRAGWLAGWLALACALPLHARREYVRSLARAGCNACSSRVIETLCAGPWNAHGWACVRAWGIEGKKPVSHAGVLDWAGLAGLAGLSSSTRDRDTSQTVSRVPPLQLHTTISPVTLPGILIPR
jgi:hypothetical protein